MASSSSSTSSSSAAEASSLGKRSNSGAGSDDKKARRPVRVWTDGCFDMMHFGHANALRQAKALGDYLIVGVHSDAEIRKHKGPPVMSEEERYQAVAACKWVDEVVRDAPWYTQLAMLDKHDVDFAVHGDDIVTGADGIDCYHEVKAAGRFRTVPRTEGISTTDLVGRMLLLTRDHHRPGAIESVASKDLREMSSGGAKHSPYTGVSHFLPTSRKIVQFSEGREPRPDDVVVYLDGGFDLFHVGHVAILEAAKALGTYLIVGVMDDASVNKIKGGNYPIMNLHERVLGVLSCRFVDEVIIGCPEVINKDMLEQMKIKVVVHGTVIDPAYHKHTSHPHATEAAEAATATAAAAADEADAGDYYALARQLDIYRELVSPSSLTTSDIIQRIIRNRLEYEERNRKKEAKELRELQASKKA